ncbi:MAG TPA: VC0807 family protein [Acidimicrobiales bacterium]|nr:VC0807 family protein [Acidimicrobiales bacterium]
MTKMQVIAAVTRRSGPRLIEATVIPALLFYGCLVMIGLGAAYVAALLWSYAALARRIVRRLPIPPILVLGVIGITLKTIVAAVSESSFLYFLQPVLATLVLGMVFLISVVVGRPLIGRLAGEFWPIPPDVAIRPPILRLFRNLTLLWAGFNFVSAAVTMAMLVSLPLGTFVAAKQVTGYAMTATTIFVTVTLSLNAARREGLVPVTADAPH